MSSLLREDALEKQQQQQQLEVGSLESTPAVSPSSSGRGSNACEELLRSSCEAPKPLPNPAQLSIHWTAPLIRSVAALNVALGAHYLVWRFSALQRYKSDQGIYWVSYACIYFLGEVSRPRLTLPTTESFGNHRADYSLQKSERELWSRRQQRVLTCVF